MDCTVTIVSASVNTTSRAWLDDLFTITRWLALFIPAFRRSSTLKYKHIIKPETLSSNATYHFIRQLMNIIILCLTAALLFYVCFHPVTGEYYKYLFYNLKPITLWCWTAFDFTCNKRSGWLFGLTFWCSPSSSKPLESVPGNPWTWQGAWNQCRTQWNVSYFHFEVFPLKVFVTKKNRNSSQSLNQTLNLPGTVYVLYSLLL